MRAALTLALLVATTSAARAEDPAKKLASLSGKKQSSPAPQTSRQQLDAKLARRIGQPPEPVINIRNTWTKEVLVLPAQAQTTALDQETLDSFFRCHFTNQRPKFDRRLLGVLAQAAQKFQAQTIHIVSGFRAPKYNLMLRKKGREVARNSQHTDGNAVDFRIPGVTTRQLHAFVKSLKLGGVGLYLGSQFVHADVGPIRYWTGR